MDLRLFHSADNPNHNYKNFDRLNSWTGLQSCRFLEWTGWYNSSIDLRLLGHYRRFQLYKKHRRHQANDLPLIQGYILQYRASEKIRRHFYLFISRFPAIWGLPDEKVELHAINKLLIYERSSVLSEFLTTAELDFEQALKKAMEQIHAPEFISPASIEKESIRETQTIVEKETIIKQPAKDLAGKEKGVFSKKQILIFFDLLTRAGLKDRILLAKTDKHEAIANFLQAITGKGSDTWREMLRDYKDNDLYSFNTPEERANLAGILKNIANIAYHAGFRSITALAESKIVDLG